MSSYSKALRINIISDIHFASASEKARCDHPYASISNPLQRWCVKQYRQWLWMRDLFAHNHLLDRFLEQSAGAELVVANGDYSCDSAAIGVADDAAHQSAEECLAKLREAFGERFHAVIGDHEIGKKMMAADVGGLRLASFRKAQISLGLLPFWKRELGRYLLVGITSTVVAWPIYEPEALPGERIEWERLRHDHMAEIRETFAALDPSQRVLLFCHDPSALPFLWQDEMVRAKLPQIERTIIGHLHSNVIFRLSGWLSGMPSVRFLGHTPRRLSEALRESRHWLPFKPLLCPSTSGIQLLKDGGYLVASLDLSGRKPAHFELHRLQW